MRVNKKILFNYSRTFLRSYHASKCIFVFIILNHVFFCVCELGWVSNRRLFISYYIGFTLFVQMNSTYEIVRGHFFKMYFTQSNDVSPKKVFFFFYPKLCLESGVRLLSCACNVYKWGLRCFLNMSWFNWTSLWDDLNSRLYILLYGRPVIS